MDAFYAAIEQRDRPELAGKPVIVGGLGPRGVVSTASYEARRFGVHSALPTARARALCPGGVFIPSRMETYVEVSRIIQGIFQRYTDLVEPLSLDEAFLDVTGSTRLFGDGQRIAEAIRRDVRNETRLAVSVGVAASKFVAKVASDLEKPDGLTIVTPGREPEFLGALPVSRLWGAGKVTRARMQELGLRTIGDIQRLSVETLVAHFGKSAGPHYHALCRGLDERPVVVGRAPRSISRETTFATDVSDGTRLKAVLLALAEDVGQRLRRQGLEGRTVRLKLRYPPFETLSRQVQLERASDEDVVVYGEGLRMLEATRAPHQPVRLIGLGVTGLAPAGESGHQSELFAASDPAADANPVDRTLDAIRERFGQDAVARAATRQGGEKPPERAPRTPDDAD